MSKIKSANVALSRVEDKIWIDQEVYHRESQRDLEALGRSSKLLMKILAVFNAFAPTNIGLYLCLKHLFEI